MKQLYAPWREDYTTHVAHKNNDGGQDSCVFCQQIAQTQDEKYFILRRFEHNVIMFNKYPYNAGHLLILPLKHFQSLDQLSPAGRAELMELTNSANLILASLLHPDGFNVGLNIGKAAGAGIPSHLHLHLLPRFSGDTNFLPTLSDTKVISYDLHELYTKLKPEFDKI